VALHYADRFTFKHCEFNKPFGSLDYVDAWEQAVEHGAKIILTDSMSHEHQGPGGLLDYQQEIAKQKAGGDEKKLQRVQGLAWTEPKARRTAMQDHLLHLGNKAAMLFCFRAKNASKPVMVGGKQEWVRQGWVPIGSNDLVYEMTASMLLLPAANGKPTWQPEFPGEREMIKLPEQFRGVFADGRALDERHGREMMEWAKGGDAPAVPVIDTAVDEGRTAATNGTNALRTWWDGLGGADKRRLKDTLNTKLKPAAKAADEAGADVPFDEAVA
jgi:hypothetical protein